MRGALKAIAWTLGSIVFLLVIAVGIALFAYPRMATYLSGYLSEHFEVPVAINNMRLDWNSIYIHDIDISNPEKSTLPTALKVEKTHLKAPLPTYFKNDIEVEEIRLDNIYTSIEFYDKSNNVGNWTVLIHKFDTNESFGRRAGRKSSVEPTGQSVLIKKLIMTNITIDLKLYGRSVKRLRTIPYLEFENVGTEKGFPVEEITEIIVQQLMGHIFSLEGLSSMFKSVIELPASAAGGLIKGIFGG